MSDTQLRAGAVLAPNESAVSAVSWAAVFCGALVALAVTLVLLALAAGLGFASLSPWPGRGASAGAFTVATAIALIVIQWLSAGMGGYLTGRMRTKWVGVHTHEVFFRDTANGLLAWALATVTGAVLLAASAGGTLHAAAGAASGAAAAQAAVHRPAASRPASDAPVSGYELDRLFRTATPSPTGATAAAGGPAPAQAPPGAPARREASRILVHAMAAGGMQPADHDYLAALVAARTGLSRPEAAKRVDAAIARAKAAMTRLRQAADAARKAGSALSIATALSMLIGAFIACVAAAYGGSLRDQG